MPEPEQATAGSLNTSLVGKLDDTSQSCPPPPSENQDLAPIKLSDDIILSKASSGSCPASLDLAVDVPKSLEESAMTVPERLKGMLFFEV